MMNDDFMDFLDYMDLFDDFDQPTSVPATRGRGRQYFESYEDSLGYEVEMWNTRRAVGPCVNCADNLSATRPSDLVLLLQVLIRREQRYPDEFRVEYAKSDRSTCQGCLKKNTKGRSKNIKERLYDRRCKGMGGWYKWHHVDCFAKHRLFVEYYGSGDQLHGAAILSREERERLKAALPKIIRDDVTPPAKKFRSESQPPPKMIKTPEDTKETRLMKKQAEELSITKDLISKLENTEILAFLIRNNQEVPTNIVDLASDILYFGVPEPCPSCKGQLIFNSNFGYKCTGNAIEQTKCEYVTQNPKRRKCEIPNEMKTFLFQKFHALTKSKLKKRMYNIPAIEVLSMP